MNKTTRLAVLIAGFALAGSSTATAQAQKPGVGFVDINVGAQTQSRTLDTSATFPLYGETAAVNAAHAVDGGGLFDISGGYRIKPAFAVGVGFSVFSNSGDGTLVASIPSPIIINRPAVSTSSATGLKHRETATHIMAIWMMPITEEIDVAVSAGPSFFQLGQDLMTATVSSGTQTVNIATTRETASATGVNVGLNINYMLNPKYGAGVFLRYAGAKTDLDSVPDVKVGGLQIGIGMRMRF